MTPYLIGAAVVLLAGLGGLACLLLGAWLYALGTQDPDTHLVEGGRALCGARPRRLHHTDQRQVATCVGCLRDARRWAQDCVPAAPRTDGACITCGQPHRDEAGNETCRVCRYPVVEGQDRCETCIAHNKNRCACVPRCFAQTSDRGGDRGADCELARWHTGSHQGVTQDGVLRMWPS